MAERGQRETVQASISELQAQEAELEREIAKTKSELKNDPNETVQRHIRLLHEYNEIKDVAQGLMGLIADAKGVRVVEIHKEYGVNEKD
ncbi:DNA repair protein SWI5 [Penicillium malachiteum]|nr:DNA repair protein SWI5 [Penicillium malachiteum]